MNLEPVYEAPWLVDAHLASAVTAVGLGVVQLAAPKGVVPHRVLGWLWAMAFGLTAVTALFLTDTGVDAPRVGPFSPLHLLALLALAGLPAGLWAARTRRVLLHRAVMVGVFAGVLVVAGLFALTPGRMLHRVMTSPGVAFPLASGAAITAP